MAAEPGRFPSVPDLTYASIASSGRLRNLQEEHTSGMETGRRKHARERLQIDTDAHKYLIIRRIGEVYETAKVKAELAGFASVAINPLRRITDTVGGALYRHQPVRRIDGATQAQNEQWHRMTQDEARIASLSRQWGRYAFLLACAHVVPVTRVVRGTVEMRYETVLPHCSTVVPSEYDADHPAILIYDVDQSADVDPLSPLVAKRVALDSEGWTMLDSNWKPAGYIPHDLGVCPAVPFRTATPPPGDYWDKNRNSGLAECALDVGRVFAQMEWIRKGQSRKLLIAYDPNDALPEGQVGHPERGVKMSSVRGESEIDVRDFVTSIDEFEREIRFLIEQCSESVGIPSNVIDTSPSASDASNTAPLAASRVYAALSEVRDQALEPIKRAERELAYMTALMGRRFGHADSLDPSLVRERFEVVFPPLTYMDHPSARATVYKEMISLGLMDHIEAMQRENPDLSREQAAELLKRNIESRGEVTRLFAQHGVTADAGAQLDNAQQAFGRLGGRPPAEEPEETE